MSEASRLVALLKQAYDAGFKRGNGYDWGCEPEEFGRFDEWLAGIESGEIVSALGDLVGMTPDERPECTAGTLVPFKEGEFVVRHVEHTLDGGVTILLIDRTKYERVNKPVQW